MTVQPADVYELLRKVRYDLTAAQGKLTDAFKVLNELNLPDLPSARCSVCGLELRGEHSLSEHVYLTHDGPPPAHWEAADAKAADG